MSKYLLVYASDTNPYEYAIANLHGCGLRDDDLGKAFGRMIRRNLQNKHQQERKWSLTTEELMYELDKGPSPDLYNAIYYMLNEDGERNEHGCCITSSKLSANKISSLASDWEGMITKNPYPQQAILGLVLHRTTGSKEAIDFLQKCNHTVSYADLRIQNQAQARMVIAKRTQFPHLRKGVVPHGTTHDTDKTLFQTPTEQEKLIQCLGQQIEEPIELSDLIKNFAQEAEPYYMEKKVGPPSFLNHKDNNSPVKS